MGPSIASICKQWYIFVATRALVRTEAIITQLVFEHSLRMRLKADTAESTAQDTAHTVPAPTQMPESEETSQDGSADDTLHSSHGMTETAGEASDNQSVNSSSSGEGKQKAPRSGSSLPQTNRKAAESNLIGKVNNLVTTDLANIVDARDFLQISELAIILYVVG